MEEFPQVDFIFVLRGVFDLGCLTIAYMQMAIALLLPSRSE